MSAGVVTARNAEAVELSRIPLSGIDEFRTIVINGVARGQRISALFATEVDGALELVAVLADAQRSRLVLARARPRGDSFPSMTPECPQAHLFEREIAEEYGVVPEGHPWLKPVRFERSWRPGVDAWGRPDGEPLLPAVGAFFRVEGDEVHEVGVGPVHAGVIEPGHFRFQCHGEEVFHLEIALGYQHRGVERALLGGPNNRTIHFIETLAGDTTIGHALAYAQAYEALGRIKVPPLAHVVRGIALELERLANHTGDLGALSGDVAFLPVASFCGRIRGDFLNLTAEICGSRFGRGLVRPGGALFDISEARRDRIRERLDAAARDVTEAVSLLWTTPSVVERFERTGAVTLDAAAAAGLVGPAARACGAMLDVRHDFPVGIYRFVHLPVMTAQYGDVNARAVVRSLEIQQSIKFIRDQLGALPATTLRADVQPLAPSSLVASLVEGWRGEICHVALTDAEGRFSRYKVVDPSFHNWFGLALAMRNEAIFDFPLCNKSFNLSYCGHDL
jgi:Ni,Fe-hydrogenase III large subunit